MSEATRIGYVVPHTLAFIREQILTVESLFGSISVAVTRPRPRWLERPWAKRKEDPIDSARLRIQRFFIPSAISAGPYPLAKLSPLRKHAPEGIRDASIIHGHFLFPQGFYAVRWAQDIGVPSVVTGHGYDVYRLMERNLAWRRCLLEVLSRATVVTTVSDANRMTLVHWGVPSDRVHVVPNGYDPSLFFPTDAGPVRKRLGLGGDFRFILYVGNLVRLKQVDRLIASFSKLRERKISLQLVIAGSGPEDRRLRRLVRELGLVDSVRFLGETPHAEVARWMQASDLLCLPSRMEGLPTVVLESLACGRPVVASAVGGIPSMLTEETGLLVPPEGIDPLANAIDRALASDWNVGRIAASSSRFARPRLREAWRDIYAAAERA